MASNAQIVAAEAIAEDRDSRWIKEQISWLKKYREEMNASWTQIARWTNIAKGTVSQLIGETGYSGNLLKYAEIIAKYRLTLESQAIITADLPEKPGYFKSPTSAAITIYLQQAQRGRIVLLVIAAGLGKSESAKQFESINSNVFHVTMTPSSSGMLSMQKKVLQALGERDATGLPIKLSQIICDKVRNRRNPLIIIDEAQHLTIRAIDEIRTWHDETGVGIVIMGNEKTRQTIDGVRHAVDLAQILSRMAHKRVQLKALPGDAEALAAAWKIEDAGQIGFLRKIVAMPGALRGATFALEVSHMLALADDVEVSLTHLEKAWAQNFATSS